MSIKTGVINNFLWEVNFSNTIAYKGLLKDDITYVTGCIYRSISCLIQVIYALNETYIMNEKGSLANIDTFKIAPKDFKKKAENIFYSLTVDTENMKNLLDELSGITKDVEDLCNKHI